MASQVKRLPVVLFGYDSSAFTQKARLALRLKQIPYSYVLVPSMMPRPVLKTNFNLTYRKIPVLAIGKDIYADTSIIFEALEHHFPPSSDYGTLYPPSSNGRTNRSLIRGFASYWTDRPFFRAVCGLMPTAVWRSSFGTDRAGLIGHKLDPDKLERKVSQQMSGVDLHLSLFESLLTDSNEQHPWIFDSKTPSAADIAIYFMLDWGEKISRGEGVADLTAGEAPDGVGEGMHEVFNSARYPKVVQWFARTKEHLEGLLSKETRVERDNTEGVQQLMAQIKECADSQDIPLLTTPAPQLKALDERNGLKRDAKVSIAPDDTGRDDPTLGSILALSPEEVVIEPERIDGTPPAAGDVRVHFPRIGFVVKPVGSRATSPKL